MNYLSEVLSFNKLLMTENLSTGQIALWYALMHINNMCGWKENFTAANATLNTYTRLSENGIVKARNALIQKGLIRYKSRHNKAGVYTMLPLSNGIKQSAEQNKRTPNSAEQSVKQSVKQSVEQSVEQSAALYKHKQNKNKNKNINAAEHATEIFERYENLTGKTMSETAVNDIDRFISDGMGYELILSVMDYAADAGKCNWNYMRGTLEGLLAEGIKTVEAWKRQQAEYRQQRQNGGMQVRKNKFNNYEATNKTDYDAIEARLTEKLFEEVQSLC